MDADAVARRKPAEAVSSTVIDVTFASGAGWVTLMAPEGKPATIDHSVLDQLDRVLGEVEKQGDGIRALVLQSSSANYFCVGADIEALRNIDETSIGDWVRRGHDVFNRIEGLPIPTVAKVRGYALGGGLELALACDLIYADQSGQFGQTETRLGFVTGWGGSRRLRQRIGRARAKDLCFTGRIINSEEASGIGLASVFVDHGELDRMIDEFLCQVSKCAPHAVREMKMLLSRDAVEQSDSTYSAERSASLRCVANAETKRRLNEFLNRKKTS